MAYSDLDDDDNDRRAIPSLSAPAPAATGAASAPPGAAPSGAPPSAPRGGGGTGFVNLESVLGLNRSGGEQMAGKVAQGVIDQGSRAQQGMQQLTGEARRNSAGSLAEVNPGLYGQVSKDAGEASSKANLAGGQGVGALLTETYGQGGGYGSGMRGFDAFLTRSAGAGQLDPLAGRYGGLDKTLGLMSTDYQPSAPGAPKMGGPKDNGMMSPVFRREDPGVPEIRSSGGGSDLDDEERRKGWG